MTDRLAEIRNRWAKVTPGPWEWRRLDCCYALGPGDEDQEVIWLSVYETDGNGVAGFVGDVAGQLLVGGDAAAIAAAPDDIAFLLAEIERLCSVAPPSTNLAERCTCGSGAHPRECKRHPHAFDRHVAELNNEAALANRIDDLEAEVERLRGRQEVLMTQLKRLGRTPAAQTTVAEYKMALVEAEIQRVQQSLTSPDCRSNEWGWTASKKRELARLEAELVRLRQRDGVDE